MIKHWILLLMLAVHQTHQQQQIQPIDTSFRKFCDSVGGSRTVGVYAEKCAMKFQIPSKTQAEAELICRTWNAYHLVKSTPAQHNTECEFENLFACRDGFTQIRGMCYKLHNGGYSRSEALNRCKRDNSDVAKLPNYEMSRLFDSFFADLTMFFIENQQELKEIHTFSGGEGPNHVLIYGSATAFRVGYNSILKVNENIKTNVMCAYKPPETLANLMMKAKAFEPYYYPVTMDGKLTAIRTNNFYSPHEFRAKKFNSNDFNKAGVRCQTSLKAIIGGTENDEKELRTKNTQTGDAFNPTDKNVVRLTPATRSSSVYFHTAIDICKRRDPPQDGIQYGLNADYYFHYFAGAGVQDMFERSPKGTKTICEKVPQALLKDYRFKEHPTLETAYLLMGKDVNGKHIYYTEREHFAPIMCRLDQQLMLPDKCPDGYTLYYRPVTGQYACHKYFPEKKEGKKVVEDCTKLGVDYYLSTITDKAEYDILFNMAPLVTWIGMYKTSACPYARNHSPHPFDTCSVELAYYWMDNVLGDNSRDGKKIVRQIWGLEGQAWSDDAKGVTISNKDPDPKKGGLHKDGLWPREPWRHVPYLCATLGSYEEY